jgi:hypothetical protein
MCAVKSFLERELLARQPGAMSPPLNHFGIRLLAGNRVGSHTAIGTR